MHRLAALLLLISCAAPEKPAEPQAARAAVPPPSVSEARALIEGSGELGEFEFTNAAVSLPVAGELRSAHAGQNAKELAAAGWIAIGGSGEISLTEKSQNDKRFLMRANGILDIVPLAKKELGEVRSVRANADGTAAAEFSWRWVPNDVGATIASGPAAANFAGEQTSTATLIWDGTSWSILKIDR